MLRKWFAGLSSLYRQIWTGQTSRQACLSGKQMEALVQLLTVFRMRKQELQGHFPDISFALDRLGEEGGEWEWFPSSFLNMKNAELSTAIKKDLEAHPYNYKLASTEAGSEMKEACYFLISPGIRWKRGKKAFVKANISIAPVWTGSQTLSWDDEIKEL